MSPRQSFFCTVLESQYNSGAAGDDGPRAQLARLFARLNLLFTVLFTLELAVCAFANWLLPLLSDGWCWLNAYAHV
jgi:hypothetical protein